MNNVSDFTNQGTCVSCHVTDRNANAEYGVAAPGFFGTDGQASFEGLPQIVKIPHLRNAYTKVGMFGFPGMPFFTSPDTGNTGDQIRGFGFLHDGSIDTIFHFFSAVLFAPTPEVGFPAHAEPFHHAPRRLVEREDVRRDPDEIPAGEGVLAGRAVRLDRDDTGARRLIPLMPACRIGQAVTGLYGP